jgi:hypothetical protein
VALPEAVTVTVLLAVKPLSVVVTVMVAVPVATAVTSPLALTVATAVLFDDQLTPVMVALAGARVAVSCCVAPLATVAVVGLTVTPVTGTGCVLYQLPL